MKIILGSASKGRSQVLQKMGYEFEVMAADIDEKAIGSRTDDPKQLTLMLAHAKTQALLPRIKEDALLITSDQVVVWKGDVREKPASKEQARDYLRSYGDAPAETVTAVAVCNTKTKKCAEGVDVAHVYFSPIPEAVIERYIKEGDPLSHAGGFSITDPILKDYVEHVEGERESVIGLPRELTERLLKEAERD